MVVTVFCTDAVFDGELFSDHGLMICNFDGSETSVSGGDVTFVTSKPSTSAKFTFHASKYEEPIVMNLAVCKSMCGINSNEDLYFTQDEESDTMRFLQRIDGYHWLNFIQDGWEDVYFNCYINPQPHFINGRVAGYDLTITTDSPYGYSQLHKKSFRLRHEEKFELTNYSDIPGVIYPRMTIKPQVFSADVRVAIGLECGNENYHKTTRASVVAPCTIVLDKNNNYISGISNLNNFNFEYPIMVNEYKNLNTYIKNNTVTTVDITMEYRFIRRVAV